MESLAAGFHELCYLVVDGAAAVMVDQKKMFVLYGFYDSSYIGTGEFAHQIWGEDSRQRFGHDGAMGPCLF